MSPEFYGPSFDTANLELLARFFDKYPDFVDRAFLSFKGGSAPGQLIAHGSGENLRGRVSDILKALCGTMRLDLVVPGRLDSNYTIQRC